MIVVCGEFYQIPPLASDPVYVNPSRPDKKISVLDFLGYQLWQSLDHVVILQKSMRHNNDERYAKCLHRVRYGCMTEEDRSMLNTRVISPNLLPQMKRCFAGKMPMVVRNNELRLALNWAAIGAAAKSRREKPIVCAAEITTRNGSLIPCDEIKRLLRTNDSETGNLPVLLPMIPGMPVRLGHNLSVELGIANCSEAELIGISFPHDTQFNSVNFFGVECRLSTNLPKVAFIRSSLFRDTLPHRFEYVPSHYPDETIPVVPFTARGIQVSAKGFSSSQSRSLTITQLPFVPAFASTTYKVQGITADELIAFPFVRGCKAPPPTASKYVVLSRVRNLESLFLTEEIFREDLKHFIPSKEVFQEEKRLLALHERTTKMSTRLPHTE